MLATFGAFIAVLIAIEILVNITAYLRNDVIQVKIVIATALMAIARKVTRGRTTLRLRDGRRGSCHGHSVLDRPPGSG